jgi:hypothetical protein
MSNASKRYMGKVAQIGCILCDHLGNPGTPAEVHHPKEGVFAGLSQRADDWLAIPLCPEHHRGQSGLHGLGTKGFYSRYKLNEADLLSMTISRMNT